VSGYSNGGLFQQFQQQPFVGQHGAQALPNTNNNYQFNSLVPQGLLTQPPSQNSSSTAASVHRHGHHTIHPSAQSVSINNTNTSKTPSFAPRPAVGNPQLFTHLLNQQVVGDISTGPAAISNNSNKTQNPVSSSSANFLTTNPLPAALPTSSHGGLTLQQLYQNTSLNHIPVVPPIIAQMTLSGANKRPLDNPTETNDESTAGKKAKTMPFKRPVFEVKNTQNVQSVCKEVWSREQV
jgi:hypothetical protein